MRDLCAHQRAHRASCRHQSHTRRSFPGVAIDGLCVAHRGDGQASSSTAMQMTKDWTGAMSQKTVQLIVGRLLTDEEFRWRFLASRSATLTALRDQGFELTAGEVGALLRTDRVAVARRGGAHRSAAAARQPSSRLTSLACCRACSVMPRGARIPTIGCNHMRPGVSAEEASLAARYGALIRVSEALGACHERDALFRNLARELRHVVNFDFLGLAIYDERTHTIEPSVLESTGEPIPPPRLVAEDSLTYWVVQHQQPVVIPLVESETRFPQAIAYMKSQDMRSACALPLDDAAAAHRADLHRQPGTAHLRRRRRDLPGTRRQPGRAGDRRRAELRRAAGRTGRGVRTGPEPRSVRRAAARAVAGARRSRRVSAHLGDRGDGDPARSPDARLLR